MRFTSQRYLAMLEVIPRQPSQISVEQIMAALERRGHDISLRSVQRDLPKLAEVFGLEGERNGKYLYWSFKADARPTMLPAMDEHTALAFQMVKTYLTSVLPQETLKVIEPWFAASSNTLASRNRKSARWQEKIHLTPQGLARLSPSINPDVHSVVTQALLDEKPIHIEYKSRQAKSPRRHLVSPLGLVVRERISYLIAYLHEKETVAMFAMHRIGKADFIDNKTSYVRPRGFSLKDYVEDGNLSIRKGQAKEMELELWLDAQAAISVRECPLHKKQTLTGSDEEGYLLKALVPNTLELRRWIFSLGSQVEVRMPVWFRQEIVGEIADLGKRYSQSGKASQSVFKKGAP